MVRFVFPDLPGVLVPAVSGVKEEASDANEVNDCPGHETDDVRVNVIKI